MSFSTSLLSSSLSSWSTGWSLFLRNDSEICSRFLNYSFLGYGYGVWRYYSLPHEERRSLAFTLDHTSWPTRSIYFPQHQVSWIQPNVWSLPKSGFLWLQKVNILTISIGIFVNITITIINTNIALLRKLCSKLEIKELTKITTSALIFTFYSF